MEDHGRPASRSTDTRWNSHEAARPLRSLPCTCVRAFVENPSADGKRSCAGQAVGYMGTFVTKTQSRIAVLPVGYADGYPRCFPIGHE